MALAKDEAEEWRRVLIGKRSKVVLTAYDLAQEGVPGSYSSSLPCNCVAQNFCCAE